MTSETMPPTPPPLVRIVCSPYDSDNEDGFMGATSPDNSSFIFPPSDRKKARTRGRGGSKRITFLDEISRNASGIQRFGQSMAVHANHTLQRLIAPETEDSDIDGYDSDEVSQRVWRKSKLDLLMVKALDKADMYASALCNQGCIGLYGEEYSDDDSWSSFEEVRSRRERRSRSRTRKSRRTKKPASTAVPYAYGDGNLSESLSITSDDVSYTFEDKKSPTKASVLSSPKKGAATAPCAKASLIRQRREEFLRRKDSGGDTIAVSRTRPLKRHQIKKPHYVPSQELRAKYFGSNRGELVNERPNLTSQEDDVLYGESIPDLVDSSSNDDSAEKASSNYKWQSNAALVNIPIGDSIFLTSSHLGPSVSRVPFEMGNALQMGDIILRLNGEDVSSAEVGVVGNALKSMSGKRVHVSFLRKRMFT